MPDHSEDIRDKAELRAQDVLALNFIKTPCPYVFRKFHRSGLRSHIMAVLDPHDLEKEKTGVEVKGLRYFPKAKPLKMLRIFRNKFNNTGEVQNELTKLNIITRYLTSHHIATPQEFMVDYRMGSRYFILLCGLQEFVEGDILNPWANLTEDTIKASWSRTLAGRTDNVFENADSWMQRIYQEGRSLVKTLQIMLLEAHYIPDLAGIGNLIMTPSGRIKLVDINNISQMSPGSEIRIDDRGYPVCDKSVEALFLLEKKMGITPDKHIGPIYKTFLNPDRMEKVKSIEKEFHEKINKSSFFYV